MMKTWLRLLLLRRLLVLVVLRRVLLQLKLQQLKKLQKLNNLYPTIYIEKAATCVAAFFVPFI
jgi:hypothetical protein